MAASAWTLFNSFRQQMADGTFDLDNDVFHISLHGGVTNANDVGQATYAGLTGEVAAANGYATGGKVLATVTWGQGASAAVRRFNSGATVWTAAGGDITGIRYAVIRNAAGALVAFSNLETAGDFIVTDTNTLTITPSANGIFELS